MEISAYIICKDEEEMIGDCLASLSFCSDIVVVDSGSTDATLAIVEKARQAGLPIRLFQREWPGYSAQKQFALEQCLNEWCLCLDADERAGKGMGDAIRQAIGRSDFSAFKVGRRPYLHNYGYPSAGVRSDFIVRLANRSRCRYDLSLKVHEGLIVDGRTGRADGAHCYHRRSLYVTEQMAKEITYARLKAEQVVAAGKRPRPLKLVFNPLFYFLRIFIVRRYFLCGFPGFIHAMTSAVYAFMVEAKIYQLWLAGRDENANRP